MKQSQKPSINLAISEKDDSILTRKQLIQKITLLQRYSDKITRQIDTYSKKIEKELSIDQQEKKLVKEGLSLLDLEHDSFNA